VLQREKKALLITLVWNSDYII